MNHQCETGKPSKNHNPVNCHARMVEKFGHCGICSDECPACKVS